MWNSVEPRLPGYVFHAINRAGRQPSHEFGCIQLSKNVLALWATRMYSMEVRAKFVKQLNKALSTNAPDVALKKLNGELCGAFPNGSHCAEIVVMVISRSDDTVAITSAGEFLPELRMPDNSIAQLDRSKTGIPLGIAPAAEYATQFVELVPKTSVIWVSPYTTQVGNSDNLPNGLDRFRNQSALALNGPAPIIEAIESDISKFIGNREQIDDVCILCFQRIVPTRHVLFWKTLSYCCVAELAKPLVTVSGYPNVKPDVGFCDHRVSRLHATLSRTADGYVVQDFRGRGGTFVNEQRS